MNVAVEELWLSRCPSAPVEECGWALPSASSDTVVVGQHFGYA